jgi:hypothetical protein
MTTASAWAAHTLDTTMPVNAERSPTVLPGEELITQGLDDLSRGRESEAALLLRVAAPRLRNLGITIPPEDAGTEPAEHRLYALLSGRPDAHSHYNALLARIASYARAAEHAAPR